MAVRKGNMSCTDVCVCVCMHTRMMFNKPKLSQISSYVIQYMSDKVGFG